MTSERIYKGNIYRVVKNKTVQKQQIIEKENIVLIKAINGKYVDAMETRKFLVRLGLYLTWIQGHQFISNQNPYNTLLGYQYVKEEELEKFRRVRTEIPLKELRKRKKVLYIIKPFLFALFWLTFFLT